MKYIIYYFSASWCMACKGLLSKLKQIYNESCKLKIPLEVIYISLDSNESNMMKHFQEKHGRWYAIPFGDIAIQELQLRFGVTHVPFIVVSKNDGTIVSMNATREIDDLGVNVLTTWIE
ncbi:hypothetical protein FQA39_LY10490 [Lamprigera yunnana]|nr:hypothetical protein FQA39_LY10490 [Lamprigera yunnana]